MKEIDRIGDFITDIPLWIWLVIIALIIILSIVISPLILVFAILGPLDEIIIILLIIIVGGFLAKHLHTEGFDWEVFFKLYILIWLIFFSLLVFIGLWWLSFIISLILSPIIYLIGYEQLDFLK